MSPNGWYGFICAICFKKLEIEDCAEDENGEKWDVHKGICAKDAGITEKDPNP